MNEEAALRTRQFEKGMKAKGTPANTWPHVKETFDKSTLNLKQNSAKRQVQSTSNLQYIMSNKDVILWGLRPSPTLTCPMNYRLPLFQTFFGTTKQSILSRHI